MTDRKAASQRASCLEDDVASANSAQALRRQAEARLPKKSPSNAENIESLSPEETRQMLHELQVHQIELEMQNEELRDAQVALDFERARYFDLYDLAPVGYCTVSQQGLIKQANLTVASLLGTTRSELLKQPWTRYILDEDADRYYQHSQRLVESGEPQSCELRMMKKDGTQFWGHWAATLSHDSNGEPELRAVLSDVTERKRAERESREADKRKDEFLAMLAHELRNPLAAISNATQVVKHLTRDNATVQRPREVIEQQLQHLTRMADDLLDMSRLTWDKINLKQETLSLASVLQRAIEAYRPLIDARGQQLTVTLPTVAVQVAGDSTRLVQVFGNLLDNAAKYTDTGGHIALHTAIAADEAIIRVCDNGCGLSATLLPHVFELFTQGGRSLDRSQGGLGVGLALVQSLVKMHGGEVEAHSAGLGQGSEFVVRLPLARSGDKLEHPSREEVKAQTSTIAPRLKVLVVEDNAAAAEMLVMLLGQDGDEVRLARDGLIALDEARDFQPQVVLCDIGLPGLSGFEVATRLREQPECRGTLLVALSGYSSDEHLRQSRSAGFDHHLTKPVDLEVLAALIEQRRLV